MEWREERWRRREGGRASEVITTDGRERGSVLMCLIWSEGIRTVRSNPRAVCLLDDSRRGVSRKASSPSTSLVTSGNDLVLFTRNAPHRFYHCWWALSVAESTKTANSGPVDVVRSKRMMAGGKKKKKSQVIESYSKHVHICRSKTLPEY